MVLCQPLKRTLRTTSSIRLTMFSTITGVPSPWRASNNSVRAALPCSSRGFWPIGDRRSAGGHAGADEAAFGWGWLLELLEGYGFEPHIVHPLQCKAIASARLKNDKAGAATLAQLLAPTCCRRRSSRRRKCGSCVPCCAPGAAGPPAHLLRNRIHAILAGDGHGRPAGCWSGPGRQWLASLELPAVSREIIDDCLALTDAVAGPIGRLDEEVRQHAKAGPRVRVLTQLPGVGQYTALVLLAEIGDITRFGAARKLASWAGLTPTVRGGPRTVHHGHIS